MLGEQTSELFVDMYYKIEKLKKIMGNTIQVYFMKASTGGGYLEITTRYEDYNDTKTYRIHLNEVCRETVGHIIDIITDREKAVTC